MKKDIKTLPPVDVSVNITAHKEGYYLHKTIRATLLGCAKARNNGINVEINVHLDKSDKLTKAIVEKLVTEHKEINIFENSFGDPSLSRNFLINNSSGKYILFVDGDDFFTSDFITKSFRLAEKYGKPAVFSAEYVVSFNGIIDPIVFHVQSTQKEPAIKTAILETNLYVSQNFVHSQIYKEVDYKPNTNGYGFEDWLWNTQVIDKGYDFLVTPNTSFFYRRKSSNKSVLRDHLTSNAVIRKTPLFNPTRFTSLRHRTYKRDYQQEVIPNFDEPKALTLVKTTVGFTHRIVVALIGSNSYLYYVLRRVYRKTKRTIKTVSHLLEKKINKNYVSSSSAPLSRSEEMLTTPAPLPVQVTKNWKDLNPIEPVIRPSEEVTGSLMLYRYNYQHSLATTYYEICKKYKNKPFTDIIFVPWIRHGGADLVMLKIAKELSQANRRVLIVTTSGLESTWKEKAETIPGLVFFESHEDLRDLGHLNLKLLFLKIVQNWDIKTLTVMNSSIGFELIDMYGQFLSQHTKIIVHNYAFPLDEQDFIVEAFPAFFESCCWIDQVVTDSKNYTKVLENIYGLEEAKLKAIPISISNAIRPKTNGITKRVLYANRIAREKRPEVAIEVIKGLRSYQVEMDMYGTVDQHYADRVGFGGLIENAPNVNYLGVYHDVSEIDFDKYDICFIPSIYEGVPNIVLESIKAGVYVIATDVGGLNEVIFDGKNGKLIRDSSDTAAYRKAIIDFYEDRNLSDFESIKRYNTKIINEHSEKSFAKGIKEVYEIEGV